MMIDWEIEQRLICSKWGSNFLSSKDNDNLGASHNIRDQIFPINGLRHIPESGECGWYIWAGCEIGQNDDFFEPIHVYHIHEWRPEISKFLGLAPGWRFLIAPEYEDVWFDDKLL